MIHHRIYRAMEVLKRHTTTIAITAAVGLLTGGGAAVAANTISGQSITPGTVGENKLTFPLRHKIGLVELAASNDSLNAVPQIVLAQVNGRLEELEHRIEAEYIHK